MMTISQEMGEVPTHWLSYITVEDLGASMEKAKAVGAHVCKDITELPMGRFAVLVDPQGAVIALWEFATGECKE